MNAMTPPKHKLSKQAARRRFERDPQAETFRMLWEMQESIPGLIDQAIAKIKADAKNEISEEGLEALKEALNKKAPELVVEAVKDMVGTLKRAQDGKTPVRGVDYFTPGESRAFVQAIIKSINLPKDGIDGRDGEDGKTPVAGEDYPTKEQCEEMLSGMIRDAIAGITPEKGPGKEEIEAMIKALLPTLNFADVARGLEALEGAVRLDYSALKNRPGVKMYDEEKGSRLIRGGRGGTEAIYYDLSDSLDGVTKTFTIPANRRVLGVWGSQAAAGSYVPVTDWTRTSTSITLTSAVSAPEAGQTLWLIYVPL